MERIFFERTLQHYKLGLALWRCVIDFSDKATLSSVSTRMGDQLIMAEVRRTVLPKNRYRMTAGVRYSGIVN